MRHKKQLSTTYRLWQKVSSDLSRLVFLFCGFVLRLFPCILGFDSSGVSILLTKEGLSFDFWVGSLGQIL